MKSDVLIHVKELARLREIEKQAGYMLVLFPRIKDRPQGKRLVELIKDGVCELQK